MSAQLNLKVGEIPGDGYTIKRLCDCRIVYGSVPIDDFPMLAHGYSESAMMSFDIADMIGATVVVGEPDDLNELRKLDLPVSSKRHSDYLAAFERGLFDVAAWLRTGNRGSASNAMCKHFFSIPSYAGKTHPEDPGSFERCVQFLKATQSHDKLNSMKDVSPQWAAMVESWSVLEAHLSNEDWDGAQALMRKILPG